MKIVSLLPSATEILFALGLGEDVVGVTHECDFPSDARSKPALTSSTLPTELQTHPGSEPEPLAGRAASIDRHVRAAVHSGSSLYELDSERLDQLSPDLIITQELCVVCAVSYEIVSRAAKRLASDPRVISLEPASLEDVYATIDTVASLCNNPERGATLVASLRRRADDLAQRTAALPRVRTLVLEWTEPPMSGGHWTADLLELAGTEALLADPHANSRVLEWASIAAAEPDVVIVAPCGFDLPTARDAAADLGKNDIWQRVRTSARTYVLDGNAYLNRPGPRLIDTAEIFATIVHDDAAARHLEGIAFERI